MSNEFLLNFFELDLPVPGFRYPTWPDAKSDLKLTLEIATHSRLKQGQDKKKQNRQIFYCKNLGKECFKIEVQFSQNGYFEILSDYDTMFHKNGCEKQGEKPQVIKIYNLMMLKKPLIYNFMMTNNLIQSSPQTILQKISGDKGQYFYCQYVGDIESRRKLKKRFDNIINISIKKKSQVRCENQKKEKDNAIPVIQKKSRRKNKKCLLQNLKIKQDQIYQPMWQNDKKNLYLIQEIEQICCNEKKNNLHSNSSIFFKNIDQEDLKHNTPSELFQQKEQIQRILQINQFKNYLKYSNANIRWPQSDNSIPDHKRYEIICKNNMNKSMNRKSLQEIDFNLSDNL